MSEAYGVELRPRVVEAHERSEGSYRTLAERFSGLEGDIRGMKMNTCNGMANGDAPERSCRGGVQFTLDVHSPRLFILMVPRLTSHWVGVESFQHPCHLCPADAQVTCQRSPALELAGIEECLIMTGKFERIAAFFRRTPVRPIVRNRTASDDRYRTFSWFRCRFNVLALRTAK
jgi:hypothetical protein